MVPKLNSRFMSIFTVASLMAGCIFGAIPAGGQDASRDLLQPRITHAVDESSLVTLRGNTHPLAQPKFDAGPAAVSMLADRLLLVLKRSARQEAQLQTYLQSVQDASSPNYHKFLTPDEFGKRYGVNDADLQTVQMWLTDHGLTVNRVSKSRTAIEFSGTVGEVQSTFNTSLHSYVIDGKQQWANATDPRVPGALAPVVAGLATLNNFKPVAQYIRGPSARYDTLTRTMTPSYTTGDTKNGYFIFLGPADAATIYNTPTVLNANLSIKAYDGTGVTIGIAGDSNIDISQNANYRSVFGLATRATTVVVDGNDPGQNGDAIEAYLDTQIAGGLAPNANIILYTAADSSYEYGVFLSILRAVDDNQADILNVSFDACEASQGTAGNQFIFNLWEQAAAQGMSVTVATGDSGSSECDNSATASVATKGLAVNGLASTPYNIAVGGTDYNILYTDFPGSFATYIDVINSLPNHRSALKYIPEEPLNNSTLINASVALNGGQNASNQNIVASGGGTSNCSQSDNGTGICAAGYPVPSWQAAFAKDSSGRNLPDVSLVAGTGFWGALWGVCTNLDTDSEGKAVPDCVSPAAGNGFNLTGLGGTSAASPAFAGILALVMQSVGSRLGQADYVLYDLAKSKYSTVFHDVTTGDNSVSCTSGTPNCALNTAGFDFLTGFDAGTGYDEASGLGSVDVSQLVSNWASAGLAATSSSLKLNGATNLVRLTHGQSVHVGVSVVSTSGPADGDIALVDDINPATLPNSKSVAVFTLSGGLASGATTFLPGGSYNVSAHYAGSSTFAASDSNVIPVIVAAEGSTTSITNIIGNDPTTAKPSSTPYYGLLYKIDAHVYGNSSPLVKGVVQPNGIATGTVTFKSGTATLGTAVLNADGIAELSTTLLSGSFNSITAAFPGDASFNSSTSAASLINIVPAVTSFISFSASNAKPTLGQSVTFTGSITANSIGVAPTGIVTFMNGSTVIGTAPIAGTAGASGNPAGGTVTFSASTLPAGTDNISAVYGGDGNYSPAKSATLPVRVGGGLATAVVTVVPASNTIPVNQPLSVTVAVATVPGNPAPTGNITVSSGTYLSAPTSLTSGSATIIITANSLVAGSDTMTANYLGDANYAASSGAATVVVTAAVPPTFAISGTAVKFLLGASTGNTSTITVTPAGGFTGPVTLTAWIASSFAGAQNPPTLSFGATSPVSITSAAVGMATLTVNSKVAAGGSLAYPLRQGAGWYAAAGTALACVLLLGIPARRRSWRKMLCMCVFLVVAACGTISCGGGKSASSASSAGTTPDIYTVVVTGTSGTKTSQSTLFVTVQ